MDIIVTGQLSRRWKSQQRSFNRPPQRTRIRPLPYLAGIATTEMQVNPGNIVMVAALIAGLASILSLLILMNVRRKRSWRASEPRIVISPEANRVRPNAHLAQPRHLINPRDFSQLSRMQSTRRNR